MRMSMYDYHLPVSRIARYPKRLRASSRLLLYDHAQDALSHHRFAALADVLAPPQALFLNDSAVVPARLYFRRPSGKKVEVLLLGPVADNWKAALKHGSGSDWRVCIGGGQGWKTGDRLIHARPDDIRLTAERLGKDQLRFDWATQATFLEVLQQFAHVPLPPYLKRADEPKDRLRYQTIYARAKGSVAAPTAGLHFTQKLLNQLNTKGVPHYRLTLHVSGATFLPLSNTHSATLHSEEIVIGTSVRRALAGAIKPIAVGTTTLRTLESLYWYGCLLAQKATHPFCIPSTPFDQVPALPLKEALAEIDRKHPSNQALCGRTALYLRPPYQVRLTRGLITNFHQPNTSLLALVAAFIGPKWRPLYEEALQHKYRFLSYGDACLFLR